MLSAAHRSGRSAVITCAGGGLGRAVALALASKGYIIFGTASSSTEVRDLRDASGGRASLTVCDMNHVTYVEAWAGGVMDALGDAGLNLLINIPPSVVRGPMEVLPLEAVRQEFECNVFGTIAVTNAFLPGLRRARGRILQIGSSAADLPLPLSGPSAASSAAMQAFAAVYRAELKPFGVEVSSAFVHGGAAGGQAKAAMARAGEQLSPGGRRLYGKAFAAVLACLEAQAADDLAPAAIAARLVEIAEEHPAPSHAAVGPTAERMLHAARQGSDADRDALRMRLAGMC